MNENEISLNELEALASILLQEEDTASSPVDLPKEKVQEGEHDSYTCSPSTFLMLSRFATVIGHNEDPNEVIFRFLTIEDVQNRLADPEIDNSQVCETRALEACLGNLTMARPNFPASTIIDGKFINFDQAYRVVANSYRDALYSSKDEKVYWNYDPIEDYNQVYWLASIAVSNDATCIKSIDIKEAVSAYTPTGRANSFAYFKYANDLYPNVKYVSVGGKKKAVHALPEGEFYNNRDVFLYQGVPVMIVTRHFQWLLFKKPLETFEELFEVILKSHGNEKKGDEPVKYSTDTLLRQLIEFERNRVSTISLYEKTIARGINHNKTSAQREYLKLREDLSKLYKKYETAVVFENRISFEGNDFLRNCIAPIFDFSFIEKFQLDGSRFNVFVKPFTAMVTREIHIKIGAGYFSFNCDMTDLIETMFTPTQFVARGFQRRHWFPHNINDDRACWGDGVDSVLEFENHLERTSSFVNFVYNFMKQIHMGETAGKWWINFPIVGLDDHVFTEEQLRSRNFTSSFVSDDFNGTWEEILESPHYDRDCTETENAIAYRIGKIHEFAQSQNPNYKLDLNLDDY